MKTSEKVEALRIGGLFFICNSTLSTFYTGYFFNLLAFYNFINYGLEGHPLEHNVFGRFFLL